MSFTKTAVLPVPPDEAFALITQPERLRRWQTVSAYVDLRAGGDYRWTVTPGHVAAGTYREVEPGRRVVFGWGWEGSADLPPDASTVTVTVEPAEGGSLVTLVHEGLTDEQAASTPRAGTTTSSASSGWPPPATPARTSGPRPPSSSTRSPRPTPPWPRSSRCCATSPPRTVPSRPRARTSPATTLAEHLFGSLVQLGAMAGATVVNPEEGSLENRISVMAAQAIDAWRAVDLDGTVPGPGAGRCPPRSAPASCRSSSCCTAGTSPRPAARSCASRTRSSPTCHAGRARRPGAPRRGAFADEVTPARRRPALDRLAAFAGRTPVADPPARANIPSQQGETAMTRFLPVSTPSPAEATPPTPEQMATYRGTRTPLDCGCGSPPDGTTSPSTREVAATRSSRRPTWTPPSSSRRATRI